MTTTTDTGTFKLSFGGDINSLADVRHLIFGHMVKLAGPIIEAYHSDLYHDVRWLNDYVVGRESMFYYSFNESGTNIGTDPYLLQRKHSYRFTARTGTDRWGGMTAELEITAVEWDGRHVTDVPADGPLTTIDAAYTDNDGFTRAPTDA